MVISKMMTTKQHKDECIYHKQLISRLENDLIINNWQQTSWIEYYIKQVSYQPNISSEEPMKNIMDWMLLSTKLYQLNMWIEVNQNTTKNQLEVLVKAVDHIIDKFGLANELSNLLDCHLLFNNIHQGSFFIYCHS